MMLCPLPGDPVPVSVADKGVDILPVWPVVVLAAFFLVLAMLVVWMEILRYRRLPPRKRH